MSPIVLLTSTFHHQPPILTDLSTMVSHSRRVARKAHFDAPSALKRKIMSSALSKELRSEHGVSIIRVQAGRTCVGYKDASWRDAERGGGIRIRPADEI
jgi:hypothetical protein